MRFFILACLLGGCAGYRTVSLSNPLKKFDIHSISVPAFINQSGIPHVSVPLAQEMILMLAEYPSLRVYAGQQQKADSILIGIIRSADNRRDIVKTSQRSYVDTELSRSIGKRKIFTVPLKSIYKLSLQITLIKNPTPKELEIVKSDIGPQIAKGAKILFNQTIPLEGRFRREVWETVTSDSQGMVNFTKTKHHFEESLVDLGRRAMTIFKDTMLDVF